MDSARPFPDHLSQIAHIQQAQNSKICTLEILGSDWCWAGVGDPEVVGSAAGIYTSPPVSSIRESNNQ